ncbi:MAG: hypothetical protein KF915_00635 [Polyangiaceae bacterium]|nr:hypothetical protein [Polyangiaceae bacterium]
MSDAILSYLDEQGLGRPSERVELGGKLGGERAVLCRTHAGVWLVGARSRSEGQHVDVLSATLRYQTGRITDQLDIGGLELRVPAGRAKDVKRLLCLGRLAQRARREVPVAAPERSALLAPRSEAEALALEALLEPGEALLAWLPTATELPIRSEILEETQAPARFLLTDRRAALVALSEVGDLKVEPVDVSRFELDGRARRPTLKAAGSEWRVPSDWRDAYGTLDKVVTTAGAQRMLRAARGEWRLHRASTAPALTGAFTPLLTKLSTHDDLDVALEARFAAAVLELARGRTVAAEALGRALDEAPGSPERAARIWSSWRLPREATLKLLAELPTELSARPFAVALHREVHRSAEEPSQGPSLSPEERALADAQLADHLILAGRREEARRMLAERIDELPSEVLDDLFPAPDADLTRGVGGQTIHIQLYELLNRAHDDGADPAALAELARLQPLVPERLEALAEAAPPPLARRAREALACLRPGGLRPSPSPPLGETLALPKHLVEGVLPHPLTREGSALLSRLQGFIADVEVPNVGVLRDYCERISARDTEASRTLHAAALAFGVTGVEGYISRGKKSIGTRAYEGRPPFVLVGGRHLDEDPAYRMSPAELRFVIGAEVAHLRYGHTRITSSELWAGALSTGRQSLDLALEVLPLLRGISLVGRVGRLAQRLKGGDAARILRGAKAIDRLRVSYTGKLPLLPQAAEVDPSVITTPNEALLTAHRVMQLSADRAGLVFSGQLSAALRALFLVRPDFRAELGGVEESGASEILGRRTEDGQMAYQDLAVRVASLVGFYLSEDYARLRGALTGRADEPLLLMAPKG